MACSDRKLLIRMFKVIIPLLCILVCVIISVINYRDDYFEEFSKSCDNECNHDRLRHYFQSPSWSTKQPKAAIYILSTRSRLGQLKTVLKQLEQFCATFKYPVIIFHESDIEDEDQKEVRHSAKRSTIFFQELVFKIPEFVNQSAVPLHTHCTIWLSVGYRHMCRFHALGIYRQAIMQELEYAWRLDDDSGFCKDIHYDVFLYMKEHQLQYGYSMTDNDSPDCVKGLKEAVDKFIARGGAKNTTSYVTWPRNQIYYNNFEISDMSVWFSKSYQDYIDYIDRTGGIYYTRWGDAPIKTIAVKLFVNEAKIREFYDIEYCHQNHGCKNQLLLKVKNCFWVFLLILAFWSFGFLLLIFSDLE